MKPRPPQITIENGSFKKIPQKAAVFAESFVIITDQNLKTKAEKLLGLMRQRKLACHMIVLPSGEKTKSLAFVEKISASLLKLKIKRDCALIAFGGGVIGDLVGFIAAIYMRGIPWIAIPTTLIAMGDSCIGGKTGIDLAEGKNLLGAFYTPKMVVIDPLLLKNMPDRPFRYGISEIIKHAILASGGFFKFLEKNADVILKRDPAVLKKIIKESVRIKSAIVSKDERESIKKNGVPGTRMLLNYGHTVGHALEKLSGYTLPHGEAVAIGMVAENRAAVGKGLLKEEEASRIKALIKKFRLPTEIPGNYTGAQIKKAMETDKKNLNRGLYFALPVKIGKAKTVVI